VADNYSRQGETFRALELESVKLPTVFVSTMLPTVLTGNQTISVATGSDSTLTVPSGATHALLTVDTGGGNIRYWEDGSSPSTTAGLLVPAGAAAELTNLGDVKMRATTGTVAVNVSYRKYGS
jgi:hypothetical protein